MKFFYIFSNKIANYRNYYFVVLNKKKIFFTILFLLPFLGNSQNELQVRKIDSLKNIISNAKNDTLKVGAWLAWDDLIYFSDPDLDIKLNRWVDSLSTLKLKGVISKNERKFYSTAKAKAIYNTGTNLQAKGKIDEAMIKFEESSKIAKKNGDKKIVVSNLTNIAAIYKQKGDLNKAITLIYQCLKESESLGDNYSTGNAWLNLGSLYEMQGEYEKALDCNNNSLKLMNKANNKVGIATAYNNLGTVYARMDNEEKALDYYLKSLAIRKEIGSIRGIAVSTYNVGDLYLSKKDYAQAEFYLNESLKLFQESLDNKGVAKALNDLSILYYDSGNLPKAVSLAEKSFQISKDLQLAQEYGKASENLWTFYKATGKYHLSLQMHELYTQIKDSLTSEDNKMELMRHQFKYQYEKQAMADSVKSEEEKKMKDLLILKQELELDAKRSQQFLLYGGLGFVLLFAFFMYNRFRITNKQKIVIEEQKLIVEEKNKEITDSITYAKRIQKAILPTEKNIEEILPESFIIYKPKDIVAGDFYWMETVVLRNEKATYDQNSAFDSHQILFAACDCTGHGVPGAMVSVICHNGLNRSVREYGLNDPGKILDKTTKLVLAEFEKSEEDVKDGMDISLVSLEFKSLGQNTKLPTDDNRITLKWSGANNPLWIFRASKLIEFKADKQPIGKHENSKPFTTHEFELKKGDTIYLFTDGFKDQFGGDKGKKMKGTNFKKLLQSVQFSSMAEQNLIINDAFEKWKGNYEQNDDVCLIGIRI